MGRFVPINLDITRLEQRAPKVTGAKTYYDGKQCWQYKVVYDRPGSYTFSVPEGVTCLRTVIVGGGGKPKCGTSGNCCSSAGAGGAYSEKCMTVIGGNTIAVVVGAQEDDSTVACNGTPVHTAGGASGCLAGAASGGDWDSTGGTPGFVRHHNGEFCGDCKYTCLTTCCGYCIVYQYTDANNGATSCCNTSVIGGASAGSPRNICGGDSSRICGYLHSSVGTGGGGIGSQGMCDNTVWHYNCCSCICTTWQGDGLPKHENYPTSAQGGWGSAPFKMKQCRAINMPSCCGGSARAGTAGTGGPGGNDQFGWMLEWGVNRHCRYPYGAGYPNTKYREHYQIHPPEKQDWWDITDICGSGSVGIWRQMNFQRCACVGHSYGYRPENSGEGAGTGAVTSYCCCLCWRGDMYTATNTTCSGPLLNWTVLCHLGLCGKCDDAYLPAMKKALFPFFITCAGTLGGSGGTSYRGISSKAGFGGGGGQMKCGFLCVCHGGTFDTCNGDGSTPLAFPPCLLDQMVSNAGTGLAIIYYKEAEE